jgi:acyl-coenzyme A synthetase/AMP-(fatty) acid ligase
MPFPPWTWNIPARFNIGVACTDAYLGTPIAGRDAVVIDDDERGDQRATFAELAALTSRFAEVLRHFPVSAGDRVLIRLPNCIEYPIVFLGALKRGAVAVPTSTMLTGEELLHLLDDSGAAVLVTTVETWQAEHGALDALPSLRHVLVVGEGELAAPRRLSLDRFASALDRIERWEEPEATRADDPAYLVYTSGTTGYPKGVLHAHRALIGRQPASEYWFDFDAAGDRVLHAGKYNWTYVLGTGLMDPLCRGHTAIVHEGSSDADVWPRIIAKHGATIFIAVPTIYRHILQKTATSNADVPTLRHCMSAGEPLSDEVLRGWRERFGLDIYEALGMSEFSYYMCETKSRPIRPGSAGFIQPGHDVRLLDPRTLQEVPPNHEGMLCIRSGDPNLMLHYWNQPEETERCFRDGWFLTGDYARRDDDGYVWFLGRKDDLINTFGYRVSPHEVERVLKDHPDIADAAVVGEQVNADKTIVAAYVVAAPGSNLSAEDVLAYGQQHLASYKSPRVAYLVDQLPRTRVGKTKRSALAPSQARARATTAQ